MQSVRTWSVYLPASLTWSMTLPLFLQGLSMRRRSRMLLTPIAFMSEALHNGSHSNCVPLLCMFRCVPPCCSRLHTLAKHTHTILITQISQEDVCTP